MAEKERLSRSSVCGASFSMPGSWSCQKKNICHLFIGIKYLLQICRVSLHRYWKIWGLIYQISDHLMSEQKYNEFYI